MGEAELDAIRRVFESGILTNGPETAAFESTFASRHAAEHGVAFANGTVALAGLYLALGIGPGDEVIVPSFTFISTATSVAHVGARPVFADIDAETFNIDPADVAHRITPTTKAIVAVHYGGQPADLAELRAIADDAGILLLEDAAEAHGASYQGRPVGAIGRAGMFSFTPTKNITTGEGAIVTTNDEALADRLRLLRNHGMGPDRRHVMLGYNWRMSEMQAAMGQVQLAKLETVLAKKRAAAAYLAARLETIAGVQPPLVRPDRDHVFMLFTTAIDGGRRDHVLEALLAQGIEARLYFPPAHQQLPFEGAGDSLPVTEWAASHALSLPLHTGLTEAELDEIADAVDRALVDV